MIPAFSMRGFGKAEKTNDGVRIKVDRLVTYDWVPVPSHVNAFASKNSIAFKTVKINLTEAPNGVAAYLTSYDEDSTGDLFLLLEEDREKAVEHEVKNDEMICSFLEDFNMKFDETKISISPKYTSFLTENGVLVTGTDKETHNKIMSILRG
jgi:hypothetical protein